MVSLMNSGSGIALGSTAWLGPISSLCTYGGTSSCTFTDVRLSWNRSDCEYE